MSDCAASPCFFSSFGHVAVGEEESDSLMVNYFTYGSWVTLVGLTALLLALPVVLPPLPPPPLMLMLLPVAIFALLMVIAFVPSEVTTVFVGSV